MKHVMSWCMIWPVALSKQAAVFCMTLGLPWKYPGHVHLYLHRSQDIEPDEEQTEEQHGHCLEFLLSVYGFKSLRKQSRLIVMGRHKMEGEILNESSVIQ